MAPIYLGKRVVPSSLRYIENLASLVARVVAYKCFVVRGSDLIGIFRHTRMEISFGLRSFIVGPTI